MGKVVIRLSVQHEAKALPILSRHSSETMLPGRLYVLSTSAAAALREAGIEFTEIETADDEPAVTATAELVDRVMADDDANDPHLAGYQSDHDEGKP